MGANCVVLTTTDTDWGQQIGGDPRKYDNNDFADWMALRQRRGLDTGRIVAFDPTPGLSRARADLSRTNPPAKLKTWIRELVWLDNKHLIVADVVEVATPEIQTRWLLHALTEPQVKEGLTTITVDPVPVFAWIPKRGAKLFCQTLLPAKPRIEKVGGEGKECWIGGTNAIGKVDDKNNFMMQLGRWRVEVWPTETGTRHLFLNVLTPADPDLAAPPRAEVTVAADTATVSLDGKAVRIDLK
jgi:hypothetical protein